MVFQPFFDLGGQDALDWIADHTPNETWQTQSGTSIAKSYRDIGFTFGNEAFFALRRDILDQVRFEPQLAQLDPDRLIPVAFEIPKIGSQFKRRRAFRFEVTGVDRNTKEEITQTYTLSADDRLTKAQAEGSIFSLILADPSAYGLDIEEVRLTDVFRSLERGRS